MLVAYSMLQMVRQQVLQESMTGDDILLVRAASCKAQPSPTGPRRPLTQTQGPWLPWAIVGRLTYSEHCAKRLYRPAHVNLQTV